MGIRARALGKAALAAALLIPLKLMAAPIAYDFYTVSDGQLGNWSFSKALVHFHVSTDTTQVSEQLFGGFQALVLNTSGVYDVTITAGGRSEKARFKPGLLFTSIDKTGGGVGIGSYDSSGNFQPTYPIGIQDGIPDCIIGDGDCTTPSPATVALPVDLVNSSTLSGRAWIDTSFLACDCAPPPPALATNRGDFYLFEPFSTSYGDPLISGIYRATLGSH